MIFVSKAAAINFFKKVQKALTRELDKQNNPVLYERKELEYRFNKAKQLIAKKQKQQEDNKRNKKEKEKEDAKEVETQCQNDNELDEEEFNDEGDANVLSLDYFPSLCRIEADSPLLSLTTLTHLSLTQNGLTSLCPDFTSLHCLKVFCPLSKNACTHVHISILSRKVLNLSYNALSSFPLCLCEIRTLEQLQLTANQIGDSLPSEIGELTNLKVLNLDYNKIVTIPLEVYFYSFIFVLFVCLSLSLSLQISNCTSLTSLHLRNNWLRICPPTLAQLPLKELTLTNNPNIVFPPLVLINSGFHAVMECLQLFCQSTLS
jgi:Leucine-rich repeat (LRR) protein